MFSKQWSGPEIGENRGKSTVKNLVPAWGILGLVSTKYLSLNISFLICIHFYCLTIFKAAITVHIIRFLSLSSHVHYIHLHNIWREREFDIFSVFLWIFLFTICKVTVCTELWRIQGENMWESERILSEEKINNSKLKLLHTTLCSFLQYCVTDPFMGFGSRIFFCYQIRIRMQPPLLYCVQLFPRMACKKKKFMKTHWERFF